MNRLRNVYPLCRQVSKNLLAKRNGSSHHSPPMPPFARQAPPTSTIPEEVELVWDDMVAPETCVDMDAPNVSVTQALTGLFIAFGSLATLMGLVWLSDPAGRNPVALRSTVIPFDGLKYELGWASSPDEAQEE